MIENYKPRRWNVMPTYRSVIIPEIHSEITHVDAYGIEDRQYERVGEFKIKIRPLGFRRLLTIYGHEISQYLWGNTGKYKITIEREGKSTQPFYFNIEQVKPDYKQIFFESNITGNKYEGDFEILFSKDIGEHQYSIEIYSQLPRPESKREIMYIKVLNFDNIVMTSIGFVCGAAFTWLLTWLLTK